MKPEAVFEIEYGDSHEFMAWLLSVFQEHALNGGAACDPG